ncbi:MAG TPA: hypothetical protein PKD86_09000 [Gemmatales bacterium]|nr:hypothetical protein [Gemmatales bacterium]
MTASVTNRYMPAEDVIVYVTERLRTSASRLMLPVPDDRGRSTADGERPAVDVGEARSRKKRLGQSLVDFWTGTDCPPDSLNKYILLTARMLRFEVSEAEAVGVLQNYMAEHPDLSFSDRLSSGQHAEVSRVIRSTVRAVFADNGGQADPETSTRILDKAHAFFRRIGFKLSDRTTWNRLNMTTGQLGPDFGWSEEEMELIRRNLVPVLKADLPLAASATRHFLRYVHGQQGTEISRDNIPYILKDYQLKIRKSKKKSAFLKQLIGLDWLVISKHHQWFARGSGRQGRARQYEIGPALVYKFDTPRQASNNPEGNNNSRED